jgi:hypothetical protein
MSVPKNWTGKKQGLLTFLRPTEEKDKKGYIIWEAQCDCGKKIFAAPNRGGKSCRCMVEKDWTGLKNRRLTFIRPTDKRTKASNIIWEALCDCGTTCYVRPSVNRGATKSCGCLKKETAKELQKRMSQQNRKYTPIISAARRRWQSCYKDIDFDTFYTMSQLPCDYCGIPPHRTTNGFTSNGLDRLDSTKGHTIDNVVPCCADCNWMKSNRTRENFLAHIRRISTHSI